MRKFIQDFDRNSFIRSIWTLGLAFIEDAAERYVFPFTLIVISFLIFPTSVQAGKNLSFIPLSRTGNFDSRGGMYLRHYLYIASHGTSSYHGLMRVDNVCQDNSTVTNTSWNDYGVWDIYFAGGRFYAVSDIDNHTSMYIYNDNGDVIKTIPNTPGYSLWSDGVCTYSAYRNGLYIYKWNNNFSTKYGGENLRHVIGDDSYIYISNNSAQIKKLTRNSGNCGVNLYPVATVDVNGIVHRMEIKGDYLYANTRTGWFYIINKNTFSIVGYVRFDNNANTMYPDAGGVSVIDVDDDGVDDIAFVNSNEGYNTRGRIFAIDISDKSNPTVVASFWDDAAETGGQGYSDVLANSLCEIHNIGHNGYVRFKMGGLQPDLRISADGTTYIGNDIYNSDGTGQTVSKEIYYGQSATYYIYIQNDNNQIKLPYVLHAPASDSEFDYTYYDQSNHDITSQITSSAGYKTPSLSPGESYRIRLVVTPKSSQSTSYSSSITITARYGCSSICGDIPDEVDAVVANTTVNPRSDLSLTKSVDDSTPDVGDNVQFTVTVTNNGPSDATGVEVTDQLPSGLTYVSSNTSQGTYDNSTGVWDVDGLSSGTDATLTITARVDQAGPITNTAEVTASDQSDPDSDPNNHDPNEDDQDSATVVGQLKIKGKIFEDTDSEGDAFESGDHGKQGVEVRLYKDTNDNGEFDPAVDVLVDNTTTNSEGDYTLEAGGNGRYFVAVNSKTIAPENFNSGFDQGDIWAEETYQCDYTASSGLSCGPKFGGNDPNTSDDWNNNTFEHIAVVEINDASSRTGIDFGFSFNVVVNTKDADDDGSANRTCQGCLRQFIQNANAISGANYMRFVPAVATNSGSGSNRWWTVHVDLTNLGNLPTISDDYTTIDGTAYDHSDGVTQLDTNTGTVGGNVHVGIDGHYIAPFDRPEFEVDGGSIYSSDLSYDDNGIFKAEDVSYFHVKNLSLYNNNDGPYDAGIKLYHCSHSEITECLFSVRADGSVPDVQHRLASGIEVDNGSEFTTINHNYFYNTSLYGVIGGWRTPTPVSPNDGLNIYDCEFMTDASDGGPARGGGNYADGMSIKYTTDLDLKHCYIHDVRAHHPRSKPNSGGGIEIWYGVTNSTIEQNLIENNETHGIIFATSKLGSNSEPDTNITVVGNIIRNNGGPGIGITRKDTSDGVQKRIKITENQFYNNGGLSIDIVPVAEDTADGDGVTPNDGTKDSNEQNEGMDYPIFEKVFINGDTLHLEGFVGTPSSHINGQSTIELYKADNDDNNDGEIIEGDGKSVPHGEGHWYITSFTTNSDGTFNRDIILPSGSNLNVGDTITAIAYDQDGNTSEFSANYVVKTIIRGKVILDTVGDGNVNGDGGIEDVTVYLYRDNGDGAPGSGDVEIATSNTDSDGNYEFEVSLNGTYFVVVNSKTITCLNSPTNSGKTWAEQTYGAGGSWGGVYWDDDADPSTAPVVRTSNGPAFGGRYGNISDDPSSISKSEHIAKVSISNAEVNGVDFGFSFNVVTNVNDQDDDASHDRTCQGCLRQFIQNANAISGANHMRFVPAVPTNESSSSGSWWHVTAASDLPKIVDDNTTIDGTAYSYSDGTTVVDSNTGQIGTGGTVGVGEDGIPGSGDEPTLPYFDRLELEVSAPSRLYIFRVGDGTLHPSDVTIRRVSLYKVARNGIKIDGGCDNFLVEENIIGVRADGSSVPDTDRIKWHGIKVIDSSLPTQGGTIRKNYIGYCGRYNVSVGLSSTSGKDPLKTLITQNELSNAGRDTVYDSSDVVSIYADSVTIEGNLITLAYMENGADPTETGKAIEIKYGSQNIVVRNNTIGYTHSAGVYFDDNSDNGVVEYNLFYRCGKMYLSGGVVVSNKNGNVKGIMISKNSFSRSYGLGIDLVSDASAHDGVTPNDGVFSSDSVNSGMDYPILRHVTLSNASDTIYLQGYVGSAPNQSTFANATVEFFKVDNDGDNNGEIVVGDGQSVPHGEGRYYIGSCTTDANGNFDCAIPIPPQISISFGDSITATATSPDSNTSEFGANAPVMVKVTGKVFEDVDAEGEAFSPSDGDSGRANVLVRLYRDANDNGSLDNSDVFVDSARTDADGNYALHADLPNTRFFVVVNSKDIQPENGYNSGYGPDTVWAEQTYEKEYINGSYSEHTEYGGEDPEASDNFSLSSTAVADNHYEHVAEVDVETAPVSGIDFGFSFDVIVNTLDTDQDASSDRFAQGSLRQFFLNSNGKVGKQTSKFIMMVPMNESNWWRIDLNAQISVTDTVDFDGTVYDTLGNVRDENSGYIGYDYGTMQLVSSSSDMTVGLGSDGIENTGDEPSIPAVPKPEIEIYGDGLQTAIDIASGATASSFKNFSIFGATGDDAAGSDGANLFCHADSVEFYHIFVGARADGSDPKDSGLNRPGNGLMTEGDVNTVNNILAAYNGLTGIEFYGRNTDVDSGLVIHSIVYKNGLEGPSKDGVGGEYNTVAKLAVVENIISSNSGFGFETFNSSGSKHLINNTIENNGIGDEGGSITQAGGMRLISDSTLVELNIIRKNAGVGILVRDVSQNNRITKNSFYDNQNSNGQTDNGLAIDLSTNGNYGDGVTANDGSTGSGPDDWMDYPVFRRAILNGNNLHIEGYVGTSSSYISGTHTIEVYKADNDGNQDGEIEQSDGKSVPHGEGRWYIGSCNTASDGSFNCDLTVPSDVSLSEGDSITAIAIDANDNTSEFGPNFLIPYAINGRIFEDMDAKGEAFDAGDGDEGKSGVHVRLYRDANGNDTLDASDVFVYDTTTDANGYYKLYVDAAIARFFVVANSKDITPKNGYNADYGPDTVWAEQTFEREYISGSYSAHPEYGGEDPTVSDSFSLTSTSVADNRYEHVAAVDVNNASVENIDLGFSFDVVVNTLDTDQDAASDRFAQGSFRQFILNANGITGGNHMRFVPAVNPNSGSGSNKWWTITINADLPAITDSRTRIDGTPFSSSDGTSVRDDNSGTFGGGLYVGTGNDGIPNTGDEHYLDPFEKLEFEINLSDHVAITINADSCSIFKAAIYNGAAGGTWDADIAIMGNGSEGADSNLVQNCILNATADGSDIDPDDCASSPIKIFGGSYNAIMHNFINRAKTHHIAVKGSDEGYAKTFYNDFEDNEITRGDPTVNWGDGISLDSNSDSNNVKHNYLHDIPGGGIEVWNNSDGNVLHENTFTNCHTDNSTADKWAAGISQNSSYNTIEKNIMYLNQSDGVSIENGCSHNKISKNSIYSNQELSIDLDRDEVTPNDGSTGSGANNGMDYPVFVSAMFSSGILHVTGFVGSDSNQTAFANARIEIYKADDDGNNNGEIISGDGKSVPHGEGHWYIGTCSADANGNFDCDITVPSSVSFSLGDSITATATDADGNTSEFGANAGVTLLITGRIFEDVDAEGEAFSTSDGDSGRADVLVRLYRDANDNDSLDNSDVFVDSVRTDADGNYTLHADLPNTRFFVVVNSKDIQPENGYNSGYGPDTVWAEQTYEKEYISSSYSEHTEYGGEDPDVSDSFSLTSTDVTDNRYEHVARVDVGTSSVTGIDFGFNFNVVVNTLDTDQDTSSTRFAQGSFRQFLLNANGIVGRNEMRFVPMVSTNASGGGGNWWSITISSDLPSVTDTSTIIDGTAYDEDGTVRNDNPGTLGTGGTVGVGPDGEPGTGDETTLPLFDKPELELVGGNSHRLTLGGKYSEVKNIAFYTSAIYLAADSTFAENNLVGMRPDGSIPTATSPWYGIEIAGDRSYIHVRHNYVKVDNSGIRKQGSGTTYGCVIEYNEVDNPGSQSSTFDGVLEISLSSAEFHNDTIRYNLVKNQRGGGVELGWVGGKLIEVYIEENSFIHNGYDGSSPSSESMGLVARKLGSGSHIIIRRNIFAQNAWSAVAIQSSAQNVEVSQNSFYDNGGISIDFDADDNDPNSNSAGDGVTPNDGSTGSGANNGMDYPVFVSAVLSSGVLHVTGFVGSDSNQTAFANARIEVYKADDDGNNNGEIISGDGKSVPHGEGRWYIGTCSADANGDFDCDITVPSAVSLAVGDSITATATDANGNTSEFGANYPVRSTVMIRGYVFEDANHNTVMDASESGISGVRVELWSWDGSSWTQVRDTVTNSSGYYDFSPSDTGTYRVIEDYNDNAGSDPDNGSDPSGYISTTPNVVEVHWEALVEKWVNFGDYHGSKITGKVFYDAQCGVQSSDNNDGELDADEPPIAGVTVKAETGSGTLLDEATTDNDGSYVLWIQYDVSTPFYLIEDNLVHYISTGDHDGQATYVAYASDADTVEFSSFSSGTVYSDYNFGDVKENLFEPDNSGSGMPGSPVTYSHIFISGTDNMIDFSLTSQRGWTWVVIHDIDGDGEVDPSDTVITTHQFVALPCDTIHIIVRGFVPSSEQMGVTEVTQLSAISSYSNTSLVDSLEVVDLTTVSGPLKLTKSVDKSSAAPGEELTYTVTFKNDGTVAIDSIILSDPIDRNVEFVHDAFGSDQDVEFHYPDGTVIYLKAESGSDSNSDGAWLMEIGVSIFLRIEFVNLDGSSPGPIEHLQPGESGYIVYKVQVK